MDYAAEKSSQYRNQGMTGAAGAQTANAIEPPRMVSQLNQLEKVLAECHHCTASVEQAADRILGPVPQEAQSKKGPEPVAASLEQRLAEAISNATYLAHRIGQASQRLNSAV